MDSSLRRVIWYDVDIEEMINEKYHTLILLPSSTAKPLELGEPIEMQAMEHPDAGFHYELGRAEVISLKRTLIHDLELSDLLRHRKALRSQRQVVKFLQQAAPPEQEINLATEVMVITLRRIEYDLSALNKVLKPKIKALQKRKSV